MKNKIFQGSALLVMLIALNAFQTKSSDIRYSGVKPLEAPQPDLTILSVNIISAVPGNVIGTGNNAIRTYHVKYSVVVKNIGSANATVCQIGASFRKTGTSINYGQGCRNFRELAVGGTRTVTYTDMVHVPVSILTVSNPRDHRSVITGYFTIDDQCGDTESSSGLPPTVQESNENNNEKSAPVKDIRAGNQ